MHVGTKIVRKQAVLIHKLEELGRRSGRSCLAKPAFTVCSVALTAYSGMSLWYRASVSGSTNVKLLIEYSEDGGETWQKGAETTDNAASFKQGATQIAWGLDAADGGFLMDDIVFNGITYDETVGIEGITADRQYNTVHQYFDMSGRQIQQPSNGVYIERIVTKDGKKTVRKVMAKQ